MYSAAMSKKKRVTLVEKDNKDKKQEAKVYTNIITKRGKEHVRYIVRGWKKDGKWQRRQFSDEAEAEAEAASINVNLHNQGEERKLVLTALSDSQVKEAEGVYKELGATYTMKEVMEFFLKHNRAPDFTIDILDGMEIYITEKEREGVRNVTLRKPKGVLRAFAKFAGDPNIHTVTEESIIAYLKSLKAVDGKSPAKKKTWNNHRNELASFFKWAGERDLSTHRPWTFHNPAQGVLRHSNERVAEERPPIATTSPETVKELMSYVMTYKGGKLAKYYALVYFAGVRPDTQLGEISKMNGRDDELINLATGRIMVPAAVSKNKDARPVKISPNLKVWLEAYKDFPIIPTNCKNFCIHVRDKFGLQQDETRHSFISYYVALTRSLGDTALQAGNSESMIKKHYLNHHSVGEGEKFFSIVPDKATGKAVFSEQYIETPQEYGVV
jgi:hypothetical protein